MKILRNTRRAFAFTGYLLDEKMFAFKYGHTIVSVLFFLTLIVYQMCSIIYVVHHLKIGDYTNCLYASFQIAGLLQAIASFVSMMYHKDKVRDVIAAFQKISDQCKGKSSATYFVQVDRISEKFLTLTLIGVNGFFFASSFAFAAMTFAYYYRRDGYLEFNNIYLPFKTSLPFNENTFHGWTVTFFIHLIFGSTYTIVNIPTAAFFLAIGLFLDACTQHFHAIFADISETLSEHSTIETRRKVKNALIEAVNLHNMAKSTFEMSRILMSVTIFFELVLGILFMSVVNSCLEIAATNMDQDLVVLILCVEASTGTVLLFCYVGSLTTTQFLRYGDIAYESDWFKAPISLQKFIRVIIANAQRPLIFSGLKLVDLNLMAFTKIMKTVVTYYMMFRSLAK